MGENGIVRVQSGSERRPRASTHADHRFGMGRIQNSLPVVGESVSWMATDLPDTDLSFCEYPFCRTSMTTRSPASVRKASRTNAGFNSVVLRSSRPPMASGTWSATEPTYRGPRIRGRHVAWLIAKECPIISRSTGREPVPVLPVSFPTDGCGGFLTPHFGSAKLIYQAQEVDSGSKSHTLRVEASNQLVAAGSLCSDAFERQTLLKGERK